MISNLVNKLSSSSSSLFSSSSSSSNSKSANKKTTNSNNSSNKKTTTSSTLTKLSNNNKTQNLTNKNKISNLNKNSKNENSIKLNSTNTTKTRILSLKPPQSTKQQSNQNRKENENKLKIIKTNSQTNEMNFPNLNNLNLNSYFSDRLNQPFQNLNLNDNNQYESENATAESLYHSNTSTQPTVSNIKQEINLEKLSIEPTTSINTKPIARFADEEEYRMNHLKRGYAIIINNKRFDPRLEMPVRDGTDLDAACLESTFKKLGFDTKLFHNCSAGLIRELMYRYAKADYTDSDCFLCILMSHGENGIIYGIDKEIEIEQIIQPFKYNRTLAGKPKLFFIQACRGTQLMEGIDSNPYEVRYVNKIPMEADFLVAYSTIAGYYSWRNSMNGSWFIQSLCNIFNDYGKSWEIMQLLTAVNRRVAYYYESNTNDPEMNGKRQVPCIVSMLTKELYFKPKLNQGTSISISYT